MRSSGDDRLEKRSAAVAAVDAVAGVAVVVAVPHNVSAFDAVHAEGGFAEADRILRSRARQSLPCLWLRSATDLTLASDMARMLAASEPA